jgi:tetratricopeptide (TPR) repeat protein
MGEVTRRFLFGAAVTACLAGAAWYGAKATPPRAAACAPVSAMQVEESFRDVLAVRDAGRSTEALLALRERSEKGPHPGAARFLLGEIAYADKAYGPALAHYRKAVETDPSLADRSSPFRAAAKMQDRLDALGKNGWTAPGAGALDDYHFLQRRLAGGCE